MPPRRRRVSALNLPNVLTVFRLFLTVLFVWLVTIEGAWSSFLALATFGLASLTDWLDGYLARKWKQSTPFGIFMDPLADKFLVLSALVIFVWQNVFSPWMVIIIATREVTITSMRYYAEGLGISIAAIKSGKYKMVSQIVAILMTLTIIWAQYAILSVTGLPWDTYLTRSGEAWGVLVRIMRVLPNALLFVAMLFSLYSGVEFVYRHRRIFFGK